MELLRQNNLKIESLKTILWIVEFKFEEMSNSQKYFKEELQKSQNENSPKYLNSLYSRNKKSFILKLVE